MKNEIKRLESVATDSWYLRPTNAQMIQYCAKIFSRHIRGGKILELGPAEGIMTPHLMALADQLTLVDGAETFTAKLRTQYPTAEVITVLFEDYNPNKKFNSIVLGHVLEHVSDPVAILQLARQWLAKDGNILAAVPNARSLHRQAAVIMGMLSSEEELNEADIHHGHRRVFTPETFRNSFLQASLSIEVFGGYWLKPVSNRQIEDTWTPSMLGAFMQLGERYPDIAAEIYVVAHNP